MSEVTKEDFFAICSCALVLAAIPAVLAWVELYRQWKRYFHGKPLSSRAQRLKRLGWLLWVAAVSFYTMGILWFFWPFR